MPSTPLGPRGPRVLYAVDELNDTKDCAVFEGFEFGTSFGRKAHYLLVSVPFERQSSMDQERSTILRGPAPILDVLAAVDDRPSPGLLNRQDASLCHDHILP